eukprot:CAMPEP_0197475558 /NCGR_PEP_ID=MMETSP1309-20131121/7000_1 /TAXON_ID=464262 /ORGANISM="Genus nov. species nov., Strain RCC998" /LENGTH=738 /DNA_ID=CAMNT_0043015633 /DNA_START=203 /DNA_END=2418 /DNA_ORIENTATION=-
MVLHKFGNYLYDNVVRTISAHLEKVGKEVEGKSGEAFLQALVHCWSDYTRAMQNIRDILMYMNKTFVKQHSKAPVHELGLELWNKHLLQRPLVQSMLRQVVLAAILKFRKGDKTGNKLISQVTKMAMDIGPAVYETLVEEPIQQDTESFYRTMSQQAITSESCPSYLRLVQSSLEEESRMVDIYLFKTSKAKIVSKVEQEMIAKQVDILINMESSGLLHQLKSRHLENLELMYATLRRASNGHPSMIGLLKEHMTETGYKIIRQKVGGVADSIQVVRQLIEERALCDRILSGSFHADKSFSNGIQSCFEQVLNSNPATPEYLSVFLDSNLKKDLKGKSDEEVELVIDKVMTLFRYLNEKDVFEKYYKQHLAKRLLSGGKGGSSLALGMEEHEKTIILKLKTECGYQFTSKLESMFNDIRTSQDIMANFTSSSSGGGGSSSGGRGGSATGGIELSVQVLTTGSWPTQQAVQCQVPKELQACCNAFEQFYLEDPLGKEALVDDEHGPRGGEGPLRGGGEEARALRDHDPDVRAYDVQRRGRRRGAVQEDEEGALQRQPGERGVGGGAQAVPAEPGLRQGEERPVQEPRGEGGRRGRRVQVERGVQERKVPGEDSGDQQFDGGGGRGRRREPLVPPEEDRRGQEASDRGRHRQGDEEQESSRAQRGRDGGDQDALRPVSAEPGDDKAEDREPDREGVPGEGRRGEEEVQVRELRYLASELEGEFVGRAEERGCNSNNKIKM